MRFLFRSWARAADDKNVEGEGQALSLDYLVFSGRVHKHFRECDLGDFGRCWPIFSRGHCPRSFDTGDRLPTVQPAVRGRDARLGDSFLRFDFVLERDGKFGEYKTGVC